MYNTNTDKNVLTNELVLDTCTRSSHYIDGGGLLGYPANTKGFLIGVVPTINLQYQFWKNFVLSTTLGLELNYESSQRGYVNLEGELMTHKV